MYPAPDEKERPIPIYPLLSSSLSSPHSNLCLCAVFLLASHVHFATGPNLAYASAAVCIKFPLGTIEILMFKLIEIGGWGSQRHGTRTSASKEEAETIMTEETERGLTLCLIWYEILHDVNIIIIPLN